MTRNYKYCFVPKTILDTFVLLLLMKPKSNYIDRDQFNQIIDHVPSLRIRKWKDSDVQMSMKIAYYCALRYGSEVADLTKEDFDYDRHEVYSGTNQRPE